MKNLSIPPLFWILLSAWGILNILQSFLTEITYDEAYYWMFSRRLAWGYFDQPPMIALFIRIGNTLLPHEIGTRLLTVLSQLTVLILLWKMIGQKNATSKQVFLFFGIAASVVMFVAYGFIATPDSPLLLFMAVFLYGYQQFLQKENIRTSLLLVIAMTGMAYSKYHSVLFVLFIVLSNLTLLKSKWFWLACSMTLALITPHLYWQYQNDFPSFTYHLVSRSRPFELKHVLNYWPNQFFSFNPFFLGLMIYLFIKYKPIDKFERGIYFVFAGFLLFFFGSSFRGNVEPHWTISAALGMIILVYRQSVNHEKVRKYVYRVLFPSLVIIFFIRVALIIPFLPVNLKIHGERAWAEKLLTIAGERPVLFRNTYQKPSIYTYYTGRPATSLNSIDYRKNEFDLWNMEEDFAGKEVVLVTHVGDPYSTRYIFPNGKKVYLQPSNHFFAVNKLKIDFTQPISNVMQVGDSIQWKGTLSNPYSYPVRIHHSDYPIQFQALFFKDGNDRVFSPVRVSPSIDEIQPNEKLSLTFIFEVPDVCTDQYLTGIILQQSVIQEILISPGKKVMVYEKQGG